MVPVALTKKVARSSPIYLRPYRLFSTHTPQSRAILVSGSEPSAIFSLCFLRNLAWDSTLSLDTPITSIPNLRNLGRAPEKAMASLVQPEVSSLG